MRVRAVLLLLVLGLVACRGGGSQPAAPALPNTPTPAPTHAPALRPAPASPSPVTVASPSPVAKAITYVAIGASDTVGVGAANPATEGWVPQLAHLLGPDTRVHNLGVSGTLLSSALNEQLPQAIKDQPDLVTIWLAVNDLNAHVPLDRYSADLHALLGRLQRETHGRVLVANIPDLTVVPAYRDADVPTLRSALARWNAAISETAQQYGATVVDLFAEYHELAANPAYISSDGFHPSSAGYRRVAELFYAAARQ